MMTWPICDTTARRFCCSASYQKEHASNFMMHLLVQDVDAWWRHVQTSGMVAKYGVHAEPPSDKPWGMRDFVIVDPTGVLWRIAENTK